MATIKLCQKCECQLTDKDIVEGGYFLEDPRQLTRAYVKRAQISRRREITFAGEAAENNQILENPAGSSGRQRNGRAVDPDLQVQLAVIRE